MMTWGWHRSMPSILITASIQGSASGAQSDRAGCCLSLACSLRRHQARSSLLQKQAGKIERRARAAATFAIHGNDRAASPTKKIKRSNTPGEEDVADHGSTSGNSEIGNSSDFTHSLFVRNARSVHVLLLPNLGTGRWPHFVQGHAVSPALDSARYPVVDIRALSRLLVEEDCIAARIARGSYSRFSVPVQCSCSSMPTSSYWSAAV